MSIHIYNGVGSTETEYESYEEKERWRYTVPASEIVTYNNLYKNREENEVNLHVVTTTFYD